MYLIWSSIPYLHHQKQTVSSCSWYTDPDIQCNRCGSMEELLAPVEYWRISHTLAESFFLYSSCARNNTDHDGMTSKYSHDFCYAMYYCTVQRWVARWYNGYSDGLAISRSQVQILLEATLRNNLRQVVYTYVPLSPSSVTWYRPNGYDALRLGR